MAEKIKLGSNGNFGVKEGGTLAYNDENGVFKAIELASSRASGATYVAESGLIADAEVGVPRIDYTNGVGELLLEPQRRNLITYSEDFSNAGWLKFDTTITSGQSSPSGDNSAFLVSSDNVSSADRISILGLSLAANVTHTVSCFVKQSSGNTAAIKFYTDETGFLDAVFNFSTLALTGTGTNKQYESYSDGWYRVSFQIYTGATVTNAQVQLNRDNQGVSAYYWGMQIEDNGAGALANYVSSYIRTSGSAVTRIADAVTGNSSLGQVINSSEGVLYFEGSALADDLTDRRISIGDGVYNNRVEVGFDSSSNNRIKASTQSSATAFNSLVYTTTDITDVQKIAIRWNSTGIYLFVNGVKRDEDLTPPNFVSNVMDEFALSDGGGTNPFYGRIRELKVYDTALTDAELLALTTL